MKLIIDIPESEYQTYLVAHISGMGNSAMERIINGKLLKDELQEIRREIEKPLHDERCFDTADAKAQYIALNWVCEIIDKHIKEIEGSDTE